MNTPSGSPFIRFSTESSLMPQEEMLEVSKQKKQLRIGIPREVYFQENRVGLVPEAINLLVSNGHEIIIETNAGKSAHYSDHDYSEAGGIIVPSKEEVFQCDIVLKVAPPTSEELDLMHERQTLLSALSYTIHDQAYFRKIANKRLTAVAFEYIKDDYNTYPIIKSMSEIAGNTSILIAAEQLSNVNEGKGLLLGGISGVSPTEVVILGAGTVGEFAARSAMGLGATVKVFDNSIHKLRNLQSHLGARVSTSVIQPKVLSKALKTADVVVGALSSHGRRTPCVVTDEMVSNMKMGSVVVDVSIDQGGCFETSRVTNHLEPTFVTHGVIHYCVPNIASRVSRTASCALSNVLTPILMNIAEEGGVDKMLKHDAGVRQGVYMYKGVLTNRFISDTFDIPYRDIDLLMAAF